MDSISLNQILVMAFVSMLGGYLALFICILKPYDTLAPLVLGYCGAGTIVCLTWYLDKTIWLHDKKRKTKWDKLLRGDANAKN